MTATYKGITIPSPDDYADGVKWAKDIADSLPTSEALVALGTVTAPVGTIRATINGNAETNWTILDGGVIVNAQTLNTVLWAMAPGGWKSGANLILPDLREATLAGYKPGSPTHGTLGQKIGANSRTISAAQLPAHQHSMTHVHPAGATDAVGDHVHGPGAGTQFITQTAPAATHAININDGTPNSVVHGAATTAGGGTHAHGFTTPAFNGLTAANTPAGTALDTTPLCGLVVFKIRVL